MGLNESGGVAHPSPKSDSCSCTFHSLMLERLQELFWAPHSDRSTIPKLHSGLISETLIVGVPPPPPPYRVTWREQETMVFVQGRNDSKVLLLSQGTGSEVEPLVPASIFQEPTSLPCRTGILAGKSCPQDRVDSESQGVSSEQKSRRRGDVLRGTIGEEEESSWLPFKFRETKAEMTEREGGREEGKEGQ